jgi:transcription elongation GreA/GreB family factor
MSRAFVKEAEDKVEDLPDRPISGHRNLVTPEGLAAIEAALIRFENAQREAIVKNDALASAAAMREVRYWRARRASAEVVRPRAKPDTASFGTTVTLRRNDGREQTFRIVGEDEADPSHGTVSYISPLARLNTEVRVGPSLGSRGHWAYKMSSCDRAILRRPNECRRDTNRRPSMICKNASTGRRTLAISGR